MLTFLSLTLFKRKLAAVELVGIMVNAGSLHGCHVLKHVLEEKGRVSLVDREYNSSKHRFCECRMSLESVHILVFLEAYYNSVPVNTATLNGLVSSNKKWPDLNWGWSRSNSEAGWNVEKLKLWQWSMNRLQKKSKEKRSFTPSTLPLSCTFWFVLGRELLSLEKQLFGS